jgi:hypothetical protein
MDVPEMAADFMDLLAKFVRKSGSKPDLLLQDYA